MRVDPTALAEWNREIVRARNDYYAHPFVDTPCGTFCARRGCLIGWPRLMREVDWYREYRRERRARGLDR